MACVIGDGEAETGPLATSWHAGKFLDPARDGAVLPILQLNGWKIANPTVLARIPEPELIALLRGYGWEPVIVAGSIPARCTTSWLPRWTAPSPGSGRSSTRRVPVPAGRTGRARGRAGR